MQSNHESSDNGCFRNPSIVNLSSNLRTSSHPVDCFSNPGFAFSHGANSRRSAALVRILIATITRIFRP
jgi:hypothetical protein